MSHTIFALYFKLVTLWRKHFTTLLYLCVLALVLLVLLRYTGASHVFIGDGTPWPNDPGGGGPW